MTDSIQDPDPPGRADQILHRLKTARARRGKFGLVTVFVVVSLVAVALAVLKAIWGPAAILSVGYQLLFLLYSFAPFCGWATVSLFWPFLPRKTRLLLTAGSVALITASFWFAVLLRMPRQTASARINPGELAGIFLLTALFWTAQVATIAVVHYLVFGRGSRVPTRGSRTAGGRSGRPAEHS